ncbi:FecR family protein [Sphingobacterium spiritivorum]|uniref:FecR family protein n=1 Tax=Sphingobacterium spiritivorum TaxID=258 RepID=UPI003DA25CDA
MINTRYENVEDFLIDDTFQQYCSGENQQCIQYWETYLRHHPEQREKILQAKKLYIILVGNKKPLNVQVNKLKADIEVNSPPAENKIVRFSLWLKIAAAVVVLAGGLFWGIQRWNVQQEPSSASRISYVTANGEKKTIELSDGTKVTLNAGSKLFVDNSFNKNERNVTLIGEAFFDVSKNKDKPFVLHTQDFDIRVLGTAFNVKAYPDEKTSEAVLIHGLIEMRSKRGNENSLILKPNQKVIISKSDKKEETLPETAKKTKKLPLQEITIQDLQPVTAELPLADIAWKEGRLEIVDQDFSSLEHILERWYDVDIQLEGQQLNNFRFTATFSKEDIGQVLSSLQKVNPFKYKIYGKKITIYE